MAAGVAPRSELAAAAGLELDGGALVTTSSMRTDADGVYAAGDVALATTPERGGPCGSSTGATRWVRARSPARMRPASAVWEAVPGFWSTIGERTVKYAAWGDGFDQTQFEDHGAGGFTAWYGRGGKVVGVLYTGPTTTTSVDAN